MLRGELVFVTGGLLCWMLFFGLPGLFYHCFVYFECFRIEVGLMYGIVGIDYLLWIVLLICLCRFPRLFVCCCNFDCVAVMLVLKFWDCWLVLYGSLVFDDTGTVSVCRLGCVDGFVGELLGMGCWLIWDANCCFGFCW